MLERVHAKGVVRCAVGVVFERLVSKPSVGDAGLSTDIRGVDRAGVDADKRVPGSRAAGANLQGGGTVHVLQGQRWLSIERGLDGDAAAEAGGSTHMQGVVDV